MAGTAGRGLVDDGRVGESERGRRPDPDVRAKASRRSFKAAYKLRILAEYEARRRRVRRWTSAERRTWAEDPSTSSSRPVGAVALTEVKRRNLRGQVPMPLTLSRSSCNLGVQRVGEPDRGRGVVAGAALAGGGIKRSWQHMPFRRRGIDGRRQGGEQVRQLRAREVVACSREEDDRAEPGWDGVALGWHGRRLGYGCSRCGGRWIAVGRGPCRATAWR